MKLIYFYFSLPFYSLLVRMISIIYIPARIMRGKSTDSQGLVVNFENTIIVMTTNAAPAGPSSPRRTKSPFRTASSRQLCVITISSPSFRLLSSDSEQATDSPLFSIRVWG